MVQCHAIPFIGVNGTVDTHFLVEFLVEMLVMLDQRVLLGCDSLKSVFHINCKDIVAFQLQVFVCGMDGHT